MTAPNDKVIDILLEEIKQDALLPDDHPRKRSVYLRESLFKALTQVQIGKLRLRAATTRKATVNPSPKKKVGRPRGDRVSIEEEKEKAFLDLARKVTRQEQEK